MRFFPKKATSIFEIVLLVFSVIAFSVFISELNTPVISAESDSVGCCADTDQGWCSPNSLKSECESNPNGYFFSDPLCEVVDCEKGCCKIGLGANWVTQRTCEKNSELLGLVSDFDTTITSELECYGKVEDRNYGACLFDVGDYEYDQTTTCRFTSGDDCASRGGRFHPDLLCSNPTLETNCEKQDHIGCVEGRNQVYWYDSCGNVENIYDADKTKSFNNGEVLSETESCNPNSANINSDSCGNCDYNLGSTCEVYDKDIDKKKMKDGDYTCRDLNCAGAPVQVDAFGKVLKREDKINGESWCVYDGPIGGLGVLGGEVALFSQDLVGSRHFSYSCVKGKVEVNPCKDAREEICVGKTNDDGKSQGICRVNTWEQCLSYNGGIENQVTGNSGCGGPGCLTKCVANPDCRIQVTKVGSIDEKTCVPKYPPGFEQGSGAFVKNLAQNALSSSGTFGNAASGLLSSSGGVDGSDVCSLGTKTCTSVWAKTCAPVPKWECVENCECHTNALTMKMNNLCVSLGDCGVTANIAKQPLFGGGHVSHAKRGRTPMQPWILGIAYMALSFIPSITQANGGNYDDVTDIVEPAGILGIVDPFIANMGFGSSGVNIDGMDGLFGSEQVWSTVGTSFATAGIANFAIGQLPSIFGAGAFLTPLGFLVVAAAAMLAMHLMGCGKVETVDITYTCSPSGAPLVSQCDKCNDPTGLKPCSKYRCESLGPSCQLINENTGEDKCIKVQTEDTIPQISPYDLALNQTLYKYQDVSSNGFKIREKDGDCIEAFSPLTFGIETDVYSVCLWDTKPLNFSEMTGTFFEGTNFAKNHTTATILPSVLSLVGREINPGEDLGDALSQEITSDMVADNPDLSGHVGSTLEDYLLDVTGDMNIYVKCANVKGDTNEQDFKINFCVKSGPDHQAPFIDDRYSFPSNNNITSFEATSQVTNVFVNEPATCRWDTTKPNTGNLTKAYFELSNELSCATDVMDRTIFGYQCNVTLPVNNISNEFFMSCYDQPWLGDSTGPDGETRNAGSIYDYKIRKTKTPLNITSIEPSGKILAGREPVSVKLEAKTSDGAYNGQATCEFELNDSGGYSQFESTGTSSSHVQEGLHFNRGDYSVKVQCIDNAGNIAYKNTSFSIDVDETPPEVRRVFNQNGLTIITNENAECFYDLQRCNFNLDNATKMTTGLSLKHSAEWILGNKYHIKCRDVWGNTNQGCVLIASPTAIN